MPYSSYTDRINTDFTHLWELLLDRIHNGEFYSKKINSCHLEKNDPKSFTRTILTDEFKVVEDVRINQKTKEILHTLLKHPKYKGTLVYRVLEEKGRSGEAVIKLTITLDWKTANQKYSDLDSKFDKMIKKTLKQIKTYFE